jgi:lambda family phage portal protein
MREVAYDIDQRLEQRRIYNVALDSIATRLGRRPILYGPDNRPLKPSANYSYSRKSAQRQGSMTNWIPKRLLDPRTEAMERERIVERSVELVQDNPYAAGIKQTFAVTVVGAGLIPHPTLDSEVLGISKEEARAIQSQQRAIYMKWFPYADAGGRMNFGGIQYLIEANTVQYGEHIVLPLMINDPSRPYSLACQVINPQRLRTPTDKYSDGNIRDGVEVDKYGAPVAYWIKKANYSYAKKEKKGLRYRPNTSDNFLRIPAKKGHRWQVLHRFIQDDAEKVRGVPFFAPALKFFNDLNDLLSAELVSNIVTAAFSMFVELSGQDPYGYAGNMPGFDMTATDRTGGTKTVRYEELIPGAIYYGSQGEKPHAISANRPGTTFDPFTKIIMKAIASALNIPYVVLFKDVEGTNFAGFRSAMLDAWRTFLFRRSWLGQMTCSPIWTMLMEEAYLRGDLKLNDFYSNMHLLTRTEWRGAPKGDIEPVKSAQADKILIQANLKTRQEGIAERGGDWRNTFDQLEEEQNLMREKGLTETEIDDETIAQWAKEENDE